MVRRQRFPADSTERKTPRVEIEVIVRHLTVEWTEFQSTVKLVTKFRRRFQSADQRNGEVTFWIAAAMSAASASVHCSSTESRISRSRRSSNTGTKSGRVVEWPIGVRRIERKSRFAVGVRISQNRPGVERRDIAGARRELPPRSSAGATASGIDSLVDEEMQNPVARLRVRQRFGNVIPGTPAIRS